MDKMEPNAFNIKKNKLRPKVWVLYFLVLTSLSHSIDGVYQVLLHECVGQISCLILTKQDRQKEEYFDGKSGCL